MGRPLPVIPSAHLLARLAERAPGLDGVDVRLEVAAAVRDGRVACRKPRLLVPGGRRSRSPQPAVRFAWTPAMDRVYVIRRVRGRDGGRCWLVLTVLLPVGPHWRPVGQEAA